MRHCAKLPAWLLVALGLGLGARSLVAETSGSPYLGIAGSNVFRLKPPQPQRMELPPAPLARVKVVGITTFPGDKRALLKVYLPAIPPEPAKEVSCILTVGQREGPIEVLEIAERAGSVTVNNAGTVMVLRLEQDGPQAQGPSLPPPPTPLPMQAASRR
jgi:hypothetical protein